MSRTKGHFLGPVVLLTCAGLVASVMAVVMAYPLTRAAAAEPTAPERVYAVKSLGTLGGAQSIARDINDRGQVVGQSQNNSGQNRAFLWTDDGDPTTDDMKDLDTLGGLTSAARGINNLGQVVGFSRTSSNQLRAFLWTDDGDPTTDDMKDLGTLTEPSSFSSSEAWSINDSGVAVGRSYNSPSQGRAVLWLKDQNGQVSAPKDIGTSLGTPPYSYSEAWGINKDGQVVGEAGSVDQQAKAFLYDNNTGGVTDIDALIDRLVFPYPYSEAMGINDRGQVVGWSYRTTINDPPSTPPGPEGKAFLYEKARDGTAPVLPLNPLDGDLYSRARDIDESGRAVGWSRGTDGNDAQQFSAVLWENGTVKDLNHLIPADSRWNPTDSQSGWKLTDAYAINESGQIVGSGYYYHKGADGRVIQSQLQAFLLTPDTTPPEVSETYPSNYATGVPASADITATFFEEGTGIDPNTLTSDTFKVEQVKPTGNVQVDGNVTYGEDEDSQIATFDPSSSLAKGLYRVTLTGVADNAGNVMPDYTWTFATAGPPSRR